MKSLILALTVAVAAVGMTPVDVEAKRIGGGSSSGMQRSLPSRTAPDSAPAKPATPTAAPATAGAAAAAAAPRRSWMGPIAGLAAGLGIAALMSHMGLGEGLANFLTLALLAVAAFFLIRFLMRRFGPAANRQAAMAAPRGMQFAGLGGTNGSSPVAPPLSLLKPANASGSGAGSGAAWDQPATLAPSTEAASRAPGLPADFDLSAFERIAKMIFIRMQAANDSGDLNDLRAFTTLEMFASIKLDLQDRAGGTQETDVVKLDAEVIDCATEADRQIVSVRFHGLIREEKNGPTNNFDEVWHLARPADGSREWAIAGIQQTA